MKFLDSGPPHDHRWLLVAPTSTFTRSRYLWNGRAFALHRAPEVLPYDPQAG
ncbi:MAG TPA: hypothetical protein VHG93_18550 [Longimicrobium sp.]|nr:hypothetical protein [Longimicrobium sp.]